MKLYNIDCFFEIFQVKNDLNIFSDFNFQQISDHLIK